MAIPKLDRVNAPTDGAFDVKGIDKRFPLGTVFNPPWPYAFRLAVYE